MAAAGQCAIVPWQRVRSRGDYLVAVNLEKPPCFGTWRSIGRRAHGISIGHIPIGAMSPEAIVRQIGGTLHRIVRINPADAFIVDRPPFHLVYVRPMYGGYRHAGLKVFPETHWDVDFDHALGRKLAGQFGFRYVLLLRIPPGTNRAHGRFERPGPAMSDHRQDLCFADRRVGDKWIGRPPGLCNDPRRLKPYRPEHEERLDLTLKQAGRWAFAVGLEDGPPKTSGISPFHEDDLE